MKPHQTFLELAAMAIDYPLSTSERHHLDEHLAGCQDCVRSTTALRADAAAIGELPPLTLSDRRGDLILAAALRPAAGRQPDAARRDRRAPGAADHGVDRRRGTAPEPDER